MTREECELSIVYLEGIKDNYIEGNGYERHPLPEYYAIETAIKALEQKSETVTEFADHCRECGAKYGKLLERTRWIPVSEKLPNDRGWYLGIFKEPDTGWVNPIPFVCDYVGHETKATTKERWILRGFTDRDEHIDYYFNLECVAWMQLPKPYKAESEG